uniref:C2 DOCK-type domain-containing protein n=1 Tax=Globodera pallida TaxID=36090 RepID=A0A183CP00_GLOPA
WFVYRRFVSCSCPCSALPIYVGDQLRVICSHGQWCYGLKVGDGAKVAGQQQQQRGIFPRSHVKPFRKKRQKTTGGTSGRGSDEAMELVVEITETAKTPLGHCAYGRAIARLLDAGNAALHLPMHIRDYAGRAILTDELSIIASYKLHEEANARVVSQQSPHTVSPVAGDTVLVDKLLAQPAGQTTADGRSILLTLEHPQQQIASGAVELVLGLGRKAKGSTRPISEPLTIFLGGKMAKCRSSRALFVGLSENDVGDEHNGLTLWVTAIRVGPLPGTGTLGKSGTGEDVRQFYAYGQLDISELCGDMAEKEQREFTLTMHKRPEAALPAICRQFPAGSSAAVPYLAAANSATPGGGCAGDKFYLKASVQQLSRTTSPVCKDVQILRMLKGGDCADGAEDEGRNEVFIWLRSADLHGVGKSEKTVEASISVVDEEGVFQPEAIEVVSPEGVRHQSSFRCRVWFSEDRPKLNELIKVRLPKGEVRNLHLQILFYNKLSGIDKKLSIPAAGPFALAFLRLINNFVLCAEDEDELVVYKVEKRLPTSSSSKSMSNDSDGTRPISVAYLALWATRKEIRPRALSIGGGTMTRHESLCQLGISNGGGPYTLQNDKSNGVQFVSFVNSTLHTTNATLLQIMRWNDNEQLLSQRMHELCLALSDDQQRHNDWSRELCKFLPTVLDALFQIGAAIPLLQRGVFDTLAYICRFCEQSPQFKMDLEQYIQRMHFPKAYTFLLHHIIWYIENESEGSGGTLCHSSSSTCHDKVLAVLSSLSPLIQLALSSKRCAEMIENSTEEPPRAECSSKQLFKQHMDKLLAAIRRLLTSPGRRVICQNMALRHLESSIVRPMASDGIYEQIELAKSVPFKFDSANFKCCRYALEVMDSLSEGVQMSQKLHFIGQLIESELFFNVECRRLLLCRCLDELVGRMPPHVRGEEACGGQFIHRTRSRSNCSVGTFAASGDDSSSTNISMLESVQQSARILANLVERLFPNCSNRGTFDELQLILRKCFRPLNQTMVTLLGDPTHQRTLHALLLEFLDKFSAQHFDAYFRSLSNQLERLDTLSEMLHMFRDLLVRCPVPAEWCQLRRAHLRLFVKHLRLAAALCQRDFGTSAHFDAAIWCESILSCITLAKCAGSTPNAGDDNGTKSNKDEDYDLTECNGQIETAAFKAADEENLRKYSTEILRSLWFSLLPESKCQLMPHVTGPLLEVGKSFYNNLIV